MIVLLIFAIALFIFWILGLTLRFTAGALIHVALVIALVLLIVYLLRAVFRVI
jgi:hypothetical protein